MPKKWKVMRILDCRRGRDFGVFRAEDVKDMRSPLESGEAPCLLANCSRDEATQYARELESGSTVADIRYRRQCMKNMMYSGMN